jgi:regulatory protein
VLQATSNAAPRVVALRLLAARRLTEAELWTKLARKNVAADDIRETVAWCKREGYLDDGLFARLYVESRRKAVGDARLVGELVRRGLDRELAAAAVSRCEQTEDHRLAHALESLFRARPDATYGSAARRLERLGFPAAAIYRHLRGHASRLGWTHPGGEDSLGTSE